MVEYVELHCHSNFSFQEGASTIEELIGRALELGYPALALTDHEPPRNTRTRLSRTLEVQESRALPSIGAPS